MSKFSPIHFIMTLGGRCIAASALILLVGCTHLGPTELHPGNANYPMMNQMPTREVMISGTIPSTLALTLDAVYAGNISGLLDRTALQRRKL